MNEEWRWIAGAEGKYEVSESGQVRSFARGSSGRVLRPRTHKGYRLVHLWIDGRGSTRPVHRLVAEAFHPDDWNVLVRHLDGNALNNHHSNLAWGTFAENNADIAKHGRLHVPLRLSHCKRGHEYTVENTRWYREGRLRRCRTCHLANNAASRERLREVRRMSTPDL